ncbi:MAG TPA: HEAT repeat domain-containing protein [Nitrosopumilaceae archaeon]|nr:HEAT repeat domain-containing protein [Nitrosopumilaceae archaeon]
MSWVILDDENIRNTSPENRLKHCKDVLENEEDASKRWDAVWILGELAREEKETPFFNKAADLLVWTLENDDDGVVKHEVCYQISACNMRNKIPDLVKAGLYNDNPLARHEAIECLGFMEAFEIKDELKKALHDPEYYVKETAMCAIKRLERMKNKKNRFTAPEIL